jgi:hypothetical protein
MSVATRASSNLADSQPECALPVLSEERTLGPGNKCECISISMHTPEGSVNGFRAGGKVEEASTIRDAIATGLLVQLEVIGKLERFHLHQVVLESFHSGAFHPQHQAHGTTSGNVIQYPVTFSNSFPID